MQYVWGIIKDFDFVSRVIPLLARSTAHKPLLAGEDYSLKEKRYSIMIILQINPMELGP
jgi:hypothetical protein